MCPVVSDDCVCVCVCVSNTTSLCPCPASSWAPTCLCGSADGDNGGVCARLRCDVKGHFVTLFSGIVGDRLCYGLYLLPPSVSPSPSPHSQLSVGHVLCSLWSASYPRAVEHHTHVHTYTCTHTHTHARTHTWVFMGIMAPSCTRLLCNISHHHLQ